MKDDKPIKDKDKTDITEREELRKELGFITSKELRTSRKSEIIYLVIDCSSSMSNSNKMKQAKEGSIEFINSAISQKTKIGLIKFSDEAEEICQPTNNKHDLINSINEFATIYSTNMTDAIKLATKCLNVEKLKPAYIGKILVIVTDGMPNCKESAIEAAEKAKKGGIEIITIGTHDADKLFLERIASEKEYSKNVPDNKLKEGIISAIKMLPGRND